MASVGLGNNAALGAFQNKIHQEGLDLPRCQVNQALGVYVADPAATWRAGSVVTQNAAGQVVPATNTGTMLGIVKWNKATSLVAAKVDEQVTLVGTTAVALRFPNISNVRVASQAQGGGTVYVNVTDYTLNLTNGTITRVGGGAIADGQTVFVTYTYQISSTDLIQAHGQNFWNSVDEVSYADNRVTVITDAEVLYSSQYDTTRTYTMGQALYSSSAGLITNDSNSGAAPPVGRVFQVPSASDPYLGFRLLKGPRV